MYHDAGFLQPGATKSKEQESPSLFLFLSLRFVAMKGSLMTSAIIAAVVVMGGGATHASLRVAGGLVSDLLCRVSLLDWAV